MAKVDQKQKNKNQQTSLWLPIYMDNNLRMENMPCSSYEIYATSSPNSFCANKSWCTNGPATPQKLVLTPRNSCISYISQCHERIVSIDKSFLLQIQLLQLCVG